MTWCAILLICLLPEGLAPGTKGTEVPEPERLKAIAERLSEAPEELNRKRADEEQELVEDIISIAAIAKQEPELSERAAGVLTRVLQRETKRDASSDLKPWERVQLVAARVLVKIEGKNAAGPLQAFYERSRAPVVWARLEPHLAELGLKDADHRLKSEERSRREKILAAATETAQKRIGRAVATFRGLIKGQEVLVLSEEEKNLVGPSGGGLREMQWLVRDLGSLSVFVPQAQREELAEQFVDLLLIDDNPPWLKKWKVGIFPPKFHLRWMILREMEDMPVDCPAFGRLTKFLESGPDVEGGGLEEEIRRQAALVLERWRLFSERAGKADADAGKDGDP